jgi:hypothetical protein
VALFKETLESQKAPLQSVGIGKFGAKLATFPNGVKAIVKAQVFDNSPFRGIARDTMHEREVMAYRFDRDVLGYNLIPETYMTRVGVKKASTQEFVNGLACGEIVPKVFNKELPDWKERVAKLASLVPQSEVEKMTVMDMVIGNRDRHARNALFNIDLGKAWAIDNGASFGTSFRLYRSVFHKYFYLKNFKPSDDTLKALANVTREACDDVLIWLSDKERDAVWARAQFILDHHDRLDFWTLSKGHLGNSEFPSHSRWIRSFLYRETQPELTLPIA